MKKNKYYEYRMNPDKEQADLMNKTFGCVRFIYNNILADKKFYYEASGKSINITPASYKNEYQFLKEVDSLALCNAQLNINNAYKNFFQNKNAGYPKFKKKGRCKDSYTTNCVNNNIVITDKHIKLPKLGNIKIKKHRDAPKGYIIKSVTVTKRKSGKYYASVLYEYDADIIPIEISSEKVLGLDFSMSQLFVDSKAYEAGYPRYYRQTEERLKMQQRKLSHCERGSNNRKKQKLIVARMHEKVRNQRKDFLHKLSRQIANANDAVVIEDLSMKDMSGALKFGKSVSDNGWGMFTGMLEDKLDDLGKVLIKIDKYFPSTKKCSVCGAIKDMDLSDRIYRCECGNIIDRDLNAAINIRNEGIRLITIDQNNRGAHGDSSLILSSSELLNEKPLPQSYQV